MRSPKLIVFDLDFTLWDCGGTWCDCLTPPFAEQEGRVLDAQGSHIGLYADVPAILDYCDETDLMLAIASRTQEPTWARELLNLLGVIDRFELTEIYPSSKVRHFRALREQSGFDFSEMLFFDDEQRNITECSALGVDCKLVKAGLSRELFFHAIGD